MQRLERGGKRLVSPEHYTQVTVSHSTVHSLRPDVSNDFTFTYQAMVTSNKQLFSNALSGCQSAGELSKSADSAKPTNTCQSLVFTIYTIQLIFPLPRPFSMNIYSHINESKWWEIWSLQYCLHNINKSCSPFLWVLYNHEITVWFERYIYTYKMQSLNVLECDL